MIETIIKIEKDYIISDRQKDIMFNKYGERIYFLYVSLYNGTSGLISEKDLKENYYMIIDNELYIKK